MASSPSSPPKHKGYRYSTRMWDGLTYVFDTKEEQAAFEKEFNETHKEELAARWDRAIAGIEALHKRILERTDGKGIPVEEIDRAWREAKGS